MDDSMRVMAAGAADDIIARIMSEIEDVIGLIQSPLRIDRIRRAAPRMADDSAPSTLVAEAA